MELSWRPPPTPGRDRLKGRLHHLLFGGAMPLSPEAEVDTEAFNDAFDLLEEQNVGAATEAFSQLGYEVTVRAA